MERGKSYQHCPLTNQIIVLYSCELKPKHFGGQQHISAISGQCKSDKCNIKDCVYSDVGSGSVNPRLQELKSKEIIELLDTL